MSTPALNLNSFTTVPRRLGAVQGLDSDHVPIGFNVTVGKHTVKVLSANLSNEDAHKWFGDIPTNAYGETNLVAKGDQIKGKVLRQLEEIAALLANGSYDVALLQETDPVSVEAFSLRSEELGVEIFSDLDTPESASRGKTWAMQVTMTSRSGPYFGTNNHVMNASFTDPSNGRACRTELPLVDIHVREIPEEFVVTLACAHIRGNDAQNPAAGIRDALERLEGLGPIALAGDFNTATENVTAQLQSGWSVAPPVYPTHMCKFDADNKEDPPRYCLAAYDNVAYRGCVVEMHTAPPPIPAASVLLDALLNAAQ
jgi:hypothetical protein